MDLIERFRYIMKLNNLTASAFADEIGVQRSSVSHILSGRNKPSLEFIQKLITKYPKIDATWLINGTTTSSITIDKKNETTEVVEEVLNDQAKEEFSSKRDDLSAKENRNEDRTVKRIVLFYSDNSFEEFKP